MKLFHERLLAEIADERRRMSRRGLLGGSLKLAGGAAVAMSLTTIPGPSASGTWSAAQELISDLDVLNYALTLEHLEYAFYRDGVGLFTFGDDSRGQSIDTNFAAIRDHEGAHVETLTTRHHRPRRRAGRGGDLRLRRRLHRSRWPSWPRRRAGEHRRQRL